MSGLEEAMAYCSDCPSESYEEKTHMTVPSLKTETVLNDYTGVNSNANDNEETVKSDADPHPGQRHEPRHDSL